MSIFGTTAGLIGDYRAARRSLRTAGDNPPLRSADGHLTKLTLAKLRALSRRMERNSTDIRSLKAAILRFRVGKGVRVQSRSGDKAWDRAAERIFNAWCADCRLGGHASERTMAAVQMLLASGQLVDGDFAVVAVEAGDGPRLQLVEADLVCDPPGAWGGVGMAGGDARPTDARPTDARRTIVGGVEVDGNGKVYAYHISRYTSAGIVSLYSKDFSRVPAESVWLFMSAERVQTRGTPAFAASADIADHLMRFRLATVITAENQAMASEFVEVESGAPGFPAEPDIGGAASGSKEALAAQVGGTVETNGGVEQVVQPMDHGMRIYLDPGQKVNRPVPSQPNPNVPGMVNMLCRDLAAEHGVPIELTRADSSLSNFHAFRAAVNLAVERGIDWQHTEMLPFMQWCWRLCIGTAISNGQIGLPTVDGEESPAWDSIVVMGPGRPLLDPADDFKGLADARAANLITHAQAVEMYGQDSQEMLEQVAAEKALERNLGIEPALMPGASAGGGGKAPGPEVRGTQDDGGGGG